MKQQSKRKRGENEKILQELNRSVEKQIKSLSGGNKAPDMALNFYCECSDLDCLDRIELKISEYEDQTSHVDRFMIIPHHEQTDIEKVVIKKPTYFVVEKFPEETEEAHR